VYIIHPSLTVFYNMLMTRHTLTSRGSIASIGNNVQHKPAETLGGAKTLKSIHNKESQSRTLCSSGGGGGRRARRAVARPAVQQGVQGLDDDTHVGAEVALILNAQGSHSSHLVNKEKTWVNMVRIITYKFVVIGLSIKATYCKKI
jgi:hypothetical protein